MDVQGLDLCLVQLPNPVLTTTMYNSLGLMYLAAVVERAGLTVEIADLRDGGDIPQAKFYGFSCTTPEITEAKRLAGKLKNTIVGGGHPSLLPEDCKEFDYIVRGEGEGVILGILKGCFEKGIVIGGRISSIDAIPFPSRHKVKHPFSEYIFPGERYGKGPLTATLITSRGCPFSCAFCGNISRTPVMHRNINNIIAEMNLLGEQGIHHFKFMDDNFILHPRFDELCERMSYLKIKHKCHSRSDLMTSTKAHLLKLSGCVEAGLGVESADEHVLEVNNKQESVSDHLNAIESLRSVGIRFKPYFMTGLPGETDETIELNKQFVQEVKPERWTISTFTPYPGCDIYNNPSDYGVRIIEPDWTKYWNYCQGQYNHVLFGQTQEQMWARYEDFYGWMVKWKQ